MSIGTNIKKYREARSLTQEQLAEMLGVTFQAVSSWERDEYRPELGTFVKLTEILGVPSTAILEDRKAALNTTDAIYDWEHMKTYVKTTARNLGLSDTLAAVNFAAAAHEGQKRKKSDIPYIYHPLNMACHALSMGIREDAVLAAILLHDVVEDCGKTPEELPVCDEARELVRLLTHADTSDENRDEIMQEYYASIQASPKASLIKCIDRCNNLTTMAWGLSRERILRMIDETERYYPDLLKVIKETTEYNNAAWLLRYQIESMLDIYKRLM